MALSVLAVDDERSQLLDLARMLRDSGRVAAVDVAGEGDEALLKLAERHYDAVYLDVRMPGLDGTGLARVTSRFARPPRLVFVSAYDTAAVDAFRVEALDFLLKPVSRSRLEESLARVESAATRPEAAPRTEADETIAVATARGDSIRLLRRSSILYVQSHGDFVRLVSEEGRFLLRETLAEIERRWEPFGFVRVHRQYVVNLERVVEVRPQPGGAVELGFAGAHRVPVARRHLAELNQRLGL